MTSLERWNVILNAVGVGAWVMFAVFLTIIMHRQRKELRNSGQALATATETLGTVTETVKTLADYTILHDEDSRKWRHAIRNLANALDLRDVVRALDEPLAFERPSPEQQTFLDGLLVERLAASSSGDPEASKGDSR